jgi:hypothetical protein
MGELVRHRQTKGAENGYVRPKVTAPHLDSTGFDRGLIYERASLARDKGFLTGFFPEGKPTVASRLNPGLVESERSSRSELHSRGTGILVTRPRTVVIAENVGTKIVRSQI